MPRITYPVTAYEVRLAQREGDPSPVRTFPETFVDRDKALRVGRELQALYQGGAMTKVDGCSWIVEPVTATTTADVPDAPDEQGQVDELERADAGVLVYIAAVPGDAKDQPQPPTPLGFAGMRALKAIILAPPPDDGTLDAIDAAAARRPRRTAGAIDVGAPGRVGAMSGVLMHDAPDDPPAVARDLVGTTESSPDAPPALRPRTR